MSWRSYLSSAGKQLVASVAWLIALHVNILVANIFLELFTFPFAYCFATCYARSSSRPLVLFYQLVARKRRLFTKVRIERFAGVVSVFHPTETDWLKGALCLYVIQHLLMWFAPFLSWQRVMEV